MDKQFIKSNLVASIKEYNQAFNQACPMHILSARYSRACKPHGGFHLVIGELKTENRIYVFLIRSGGKVCVSVDVNIIPEQAVKV